MSLMRPRIQLYKLGSDCEFRFVDNNGDHVGANTLLCGSALQSSFVGLDGHPSTAEIRPEPSSSVLRQLYDIAVAIDSTAKFIEVSKKRKLSMIAVPSYKGETMGGHIHTSFFVRHPTLELVTRLNLRPRKGGGYTTRGYDAPVGTVEPSVVSDLENDQQFLVELPARISQIYAHVMNWLMLPLETSLQPRHMRTLRNDSYGGPTDIRVGTSKPYIERLKNALYMHYEYRPPSTWLIHPALAYCYLATAKLVLLNWDLLQSVAQEPNRNRTWKTTYGAVSQNLRRTKDCLNLDSMLETVHIHKKAWFDDKRIVVDAWRKLLI